MDPVLNGAASSPSEDDEWDADGFEIPSLDAGRPVAASRKERTQSDETYRPYQRVKHEPVMGCQKPFVS